MQRRHALIIEWNLAADKNVEDDTKTPDINFGTSVNFGVEQLWSRKVERSTEGGEMVFWAIQVGQAEIDDLDITRLGDQDVLNLEICESDGSS